MHLRSILDHPLFNVVPSKGLLLGNQVNNGVDIRNAKRLLKKPLVVLDDMMASGRADHRVLRQCLIAHLMQIEVPSDTGTREKLETSGAGSKVVAWFSAADLESRKLFFESRHTMAAVMPYMASEGLQKVVIAWLEMLRKQQTWSGESHSAFPDTPPSLFNVLYELIVAEIKFGRGIGSALEYFIRACRLFSTFDRQIIWNDRRSPLRRVGFHLAQWISEHGDVPNVREIPAHLFNQFCGLSDQLSKSEHFWGASLPLYHPSNPTVEPPMHFIKRLSFKDDKSWKASHRRRLLRLCLEAARLCLVQERYRDAFWLLTNATRFLPSEDTSPDKLPGTSDPQISAARDQLERLDPEFI
jgi:hypothetical protein